MQVGYYGSTGYYGTSPARAMSAQSGHQQNTGPQKPGQDAAAVVTISDAARATMAEADLAPVTASARQVLNELLKQAERSSPLEEAKLALDMRRLNDRELFAIDSSSDELFTSDERKAAELEMGRRFEAALAGPAAVSEVTGDYRTLYRAAAQHLDNLGAEQKAEPSWQAAREAEKGDRTSDPVSFAQRLCNTLDRWYQEAHEAGRSPSFGPRNSRGTFIDLGVFDAETVSAMAFHREGLFSGEEVRAAEAEIRNRAGVALTEGFKDAQKSGDPTAYARNIIALYSSLRPEVRQAAGFSENLLSTATASYQSTTRLMNMLSPVVQNGDGGLGGWFLR